LSLSGTSIQDLLPTFFVNGFMGGVGVVAEAAELKQNNAMENIVIINAKLLLTLTTSIYLPAAIS